MPSIHYFAGGNTARGFYSCFSHILPAAQQKRMYYIKGGPGVGKSTLMKHVAKEAEAKGHEVAYFHCSSDPDSLDGISLPRLGVAMMDGTAPHVYDPVIPGARDTLISLGDYLDESALSPHAGEIGKIQKEISSRFARCYRYLAAAEQVYGAAPAAVESPAKADAFLTDWVKSLPLRGGRGRIRTLFGSAFTPKGRLDITDLDLFERRITLECPFGSHATGLMHRAAQEAVSRGLDVVQLLDPLSPDRIAHVLIPDHGIALCTGLQPEGGDWLEAGVIFDAAGHDAREQSFDLNACELLCQRAVEQLVCAKSLHDELESFYVRCMDFLKWQEVLDRVVASLA